MGNDKTKDMFKIGAASDGNGTNVPLWINTKLIRWIVGTLFSIVTIFGGGVLQGLTYLNSISSSVKTLHHKRAMDSIHYNNELRHIKESNLRIEATNQGLFEYAKENETRIEHIEYEYRPAIEWSKRQMEKE